VRLWRSLEEVRGWAGVRATWREHMGEELALLEPLLRPLEETALSLPAAERINPLRVVTHAEDDIVAVDPESGETTALTLEDILIWQLDAETLFRGVARALGLRGAPSPVGTGRRLWWLGEFAPSEDVCFPVYLATSREAREVVSCGGYVAALTTAPLIFLTPTRAAAGPALDALLTGGRVVWITLESEIEWDGEATFRATRPLAGALGPFLERHAPATVEPDSSFRIDTDTFTVWHGEKSCSLGNTVGFRALRRLARRPGVYVSIENLLDDAWDGASRSKGAVQRTMSGLRAQLEEHGLHQVRIDGSEPGHYALKISESGKR